MGTAAELVIKLKEKATALLDIIRGTLKGEPLRFITYGAAGVIYVAARAFGSIDDLSFGESLGQASAAVLVLITVVEIVRQFVTPVAKPSFQTPFSGESVLPPPYIPTDHE